MIKEITKDFLRNNNACSRGVAWWEKEQNHEIFTTLNRLIETNNLNWANWLIVHVIDRTQKIKYAVFAAQQVLDIYEKKYPDDARPRKAIEAAIKCIENDTGKNRKAATMPPMPPTMPLPPMPPMFPPTMPPMPPTMPLPLPLMFPLMLPPILPPMP